MSDHIDNNGPRSMLELIDEGHNHLGHIGVDLDPSHPGHEAGCGHQILPVICFTGQS